ncbi:DNA-binding protein [Aeromonas veronii]|uniref:helix-turn-helix domain-containing transcriptional regulator n=1 Tax=Aeromonas TaxID=642 RepID=UPI0022EB379C|nr:MULTISPECIES: hypothetical protein [Aeromonas]KAJ8738400.1 hypothetical protein H9Y13_09545 [Aeromonas veronii]MDA3315975.1 hypothetical protein [Aeromonas sp. PI_26]
MKKPEQWSRFDAADGLATEADMVAYLEAPLEDGDPALLTAAFDELARCDPSATAASEIDWGSDVGLERFE